MKFNKYSTAKGKSNSVVPSFSPGGSSSSSSSSSSVPSSLNRVIWGQDDDGGDVDGDLVCDGNMFIIKADRSFEDSDDDTVEEDAKNPYEDRYEDDGNLFIEEIAEAKDIKAREHIYLPYPTPADKQEDLAPLIKSQADTIINLQLEIDALKKLIEGMGSGGDDDEGGSLTKPIILAAGVLERTRGANTYHFFGSRVEGLLFGADDDENLFPGGGMLSFAVRHKNPGTRVNISAVTVTQASSGDTADLTKTAFTDQNSGAHWFEATVSNGRIYIREFHQTNVNGNDGWATNDWLENAGVNSINIIIAGCLL